ncbi:bridging integrator 2-like [Xyrauchen texanus]|uniref:bridging integrator 2-like n=1 Tax=Xyrauchen texanus TaxID=154827 RepID=UPI002241E6D0|nr:bridging integrator 2-like [Xyrauchen texanus]XP_051947613.1 bridging integrator 2-like [Xyrauchen texanus]
MAESKTSINSKGGANVFTKRVQKKINRAQEKVLQKLGKSDETKDEHFEQCVINLQVQQNDAYRIYKDLKAYLNAVRVMRDASSRLFQTLNEVYDTEWDGAEDLGGFVEGEESLWDDYESKLRDQSLLTMNSYMSQFPDVREKVAKRGRKLVDYDSTRHQLAGLKTAKKTDDIKIGKAEDEMNAAKMIFEDINRELKEELPLLFDSRIGCYVTVFQAISSQRDIFYKEMTKKNQDLQTVMKELMAQHPDKSFVVKNFNRSGSLKRRSLRETLSPKSLKSFYDFHTSYSPRGSLRRDNSSSFKSDRPAYASYTPTQTSPIRPLPHYVNAPGASDAKASSVNTDHPSEDVTPSHESQVDETSSCEDKPVEEKKAEKRESVPASDQDSPVSKHDSSSEDNSDESEMRPNSNPTECAKIKATTAPNGSPEPEKVENTRSSGVENGIALDSLLDVEQTGASSNAVHKDNHSSGEGEEDTPK